MMRFVLLGNTTPPLGAADATRGAAAEPVAEIVTFRLTDGTDAAAFADAASAMTPFLQATDAVISRTLSADEDGLWTDHIVWRDLASAKAAATKIMTEPAAAPFMQMIAPESVQLRHAPIRLRLKMA